MSTTIGGTGAGYGILGTLIANSTAVHQQLDTLTEQVSTGLVSQTYAGLGSEAGVALDLNQQLSALQTYQNNINQATGSMQVTQTAMTQIEQIAATFSADIPNLNGLDSTEVDSVASNARQALSQVADLLKRETAITMCSADRTRAIRRCRPGTAYYRPGFTPRSMRLSQALTGCQAAHPGPRSPRQR